MNPAINSVAPVFCEGPLKSILGSPKPPAPPTIIQPPVMPVQDPAAMAAAKQKAAAAAAAQTGRASTILSQPNSDSGKLGA